ncbi:hypothetical protein HMSSN036_36350 [Paenibacillus macerans]|nr:hypothetical protein HMSSN036_36350 [Paenibacillus macerans]
MGDQHRVPGKLHEPPQHGFHIRSVPDHFVVDVGELLDIVRNPFMRIDEGSVTVHFLAVLHFNGGKFDDFVLGDGETGGFDIEYDICSVFQSSRAFSTTATSSFTTLASTP